MAHVAPGVLCTALSLALCACSASPGGGPATGAPSSGSDPIRDPDAPGAVADPDVDVAPGTPSGSDTTEPSSPSGTSESNPGDLPLSGSGGSDGATGSGGVGGAPPLDPPGPVGADCRRLVTDPSVNWRETSLQTDKEIVECLFQTLGRPVGYGANARGGYDPAGNSKLTIISKSDPRSVEQQIVDAVAGDDHNWIVFDKLDFAEPHEVALYRLGCSDPAVLARLEASEAECRDYAQWCAARNISGDAECLEEFFNVALNDGELPLRNPVIGSNTTLDGRMSQAYFRFSGFAIGRDDDGQPTQTAQSVILTHLSFLGAGHTEDHGLDPDMIRSTGASSDIWIHKNDFDLTGDSAFDVKVGAHHITMSFNRVVDVVRASLHGSSDGRVINEQITTTIHHNAFVTRDARYLTLGNTGRRVPLIRRGTSHMFNNVFVNYRKDVLSIRVGASVLWQDNVLLVNRSLQEKDDVEAALDELSTNLIRDIDDGNFRAENSALWFADDDCTLDPATQRPLTASSGSVGDLADQYSAASRATIAEQHIAAGQELVDYVSATAGKLGEAPFNSPLAASRQDVLSRGRVRCQ